MKACTPYNTVTKTYEFSSIAAIREHYFGSMDQTTFTALFDKHHIKSMQELGFKGFRGYQNPEVVKYIVEQVGRIRPK